VIAPRISTRLEFPVHSPIPFVVHHPRHLLGISRSFPLSLPHLGVSYLSCALVVNVLQRTFFSHLLPLLSTSFIQPSYVNLLRDQGYRFVTLIIRHSRYPSGLQNASCGDQGSVRHRRMTPPLHTLSPWSCHR